uniref:Uncharacterized protein n=1 Tax=Anopheles atroparvus TaxID=41427 RepID=A0A182IX63_ANOAO
MLMLLLLLLRLRMRMVVMVLQVMVMMQGMLLHHVLLLLLLLLLLIVRGKLHGSPPSEATVVPRFGEHGYRIDEIVSSSSKSSSKSSSSSSRSSATSSVVASVDRVLSLAPPHVSPGTATACSLLMLSTIGSQFQAVSPGTATASSFAIAFSSGNGGAVRRIGAVGLRMVGVAVMKGLHTTLAPLLLLLLLALLRLLELVVVGSARGLLQALIPSFASSLARTTGSGCSAVLASEACCLTYTSTSTIISLSTGVAGVSEEISSYLRLLPHRDVGSGEEAPVLMVPPLGELTAVAIVASVREQKLDGGGWVVVWK